MCCRSESRLRPTETVPVHGRGPMVNRYWVNWYPSERELSSNQQRPTRMVHRRWRLHLSEAFSAGYELASRCRWSGIYMIWSLEEYAELDLSTNGSLLSRKQRWPHTTRVIELLVESICFPLKSEYGRINYTLEGIKQKIPPP